MRAAFRSQVSTTHLPSTRSHHTGTARSWPASTAPVELGIEIDRLRDDGWVNLDTADIWEEGLHFVVASFTVPAMLLSMLVVLALVVATLLGGRCQVEPIVEGLSAGNPQAGSSRS